MTAMKKCKQCGEQKDIDSFAKNGKSGRHPRCKPCMSANARLFRIENIDHVKAIEKASYYKNIEAKKLSISKYYQANKESIKNREDDRYQVKKEHIRDISKKYRANNKDKVYAWNGTRRATLRNKSSFGDKFIISEIYALAKLRTKVTGFEWHVDHIIPLRHSLVSGLHVENNLQVITKAHNLVKSNKWNIDEFNNQNA